MAEFCKQCSEELLGYKDGYSDFSALSTTKDTAEGLYPVVLCEGCGAIQVDHLGACVSKDCFKHHNKEAV
jgi:hypothetical protein